MGQNGETITILLLIVLGFTTWQGLNNPGVMQKYLFSTEAIRLRGQWIRLLSPAFLHANWQHFAGNAITLYFFGRILEDQKGTGFLLGTFFASVAGGHFLCLILHRRSGYQAIGASGGALGILFCGILLFPQISIWFLPGWLYGLIFLFYTLSAMRGGSGVSHEAHLGGMLSGIFITLLFFPEAATQRPLVLAVFISVSLAGIWYFHANPGRVPGFLGMQVKGKVDEFKQARTQRSEEQLDALLDKVSKHGIQSLSDRERQLLQDASRNRGGKR